MLNALTPEVDRGVWQNYVPFIQLIMNTSVHTSLQDTPLYLLTGRHTYFPRGDTNRVVHCPEQERVLRLRDLTRVRGIAQEVMARNRRRWKAHHDERFVCKPSNQFTVGDLVRRLLRTSATDHVGSTWTRKWEGPYRIVEQRGPLSFRILQLHGPKKATVHAQDLKYFTYPADIVPPGNITQNEREAEADGSESDEAEVDDPEARGHEDDAEEDPEPAGVTDEESDAEAGVPSAEQRHRDRPTRRLTDTSDLPEDMPPLEEERTEENVQWQAVPPPARPSSPEGADGSAETAEEYQINEERGVELPPPPPPKRDYNIYPSHQSRYRAREPSTRTLRSREPKPGTSKD